MGEAAGDHTIHVVGGKGINRSDDNGGGYVVGSGVDYDSFQTDTGGPKVTVEDTTQTACDVTNIDEDTIKIEAVGGGAGEFAAAEVGMLAHIKFAATYNDGGHEVVLVDGGGDFIHVHMTAWEDPTTCDIKVGGALATLQNVLDDAVTGASNYDRTIYTNLDEDLVAAIDIDTLGGNVSKNTHKRIIGFKTIPGDMDYGGSYYQSPLDAYKNDIDVSKCVEYDAQNCGIDVFTIAVDNVTLQNLYPHNTNAAAGNNGIELTSTPVGVSIVNCKLADVSAGIIGQANSLVLRDCYFHPDVAAEMVIFSSNSIGLTVLGCVFKHSGASSRTLVVDTGAKGAYISGNVFYNCWRDIVVAAAGVIVCNNTSYGCTGNCIRAVNVAATLIEYNNIFVLAAVDVYAVYLGANGGTILYSDYSWAYCAAGDFTVEPWYDATTDRSIQGAHSVKNVNPQMVDPANGDFRLQSTSPCLNTGMPTLGGG